MNLYKEIQRTAQRVFPLLGILLAMLAAPPAWSQQEPQPPVCTRNDAEVVNVYKLPEDGIVPSPGEADGGVVREVSLGDVIVVRVRNLPSLVAERDCRARGRPIVLFLDDRPLTEHVASPETDPQRGLLLFELKPTVKSRPDWVYSLGRPDLDTRPVRVSVGIAGEFAVPAPSAEARIDLRVISRGWFAAWIVLFVAMLVLFAWLARRSNILRAKPVDLGPGSPDTGPYSLSRTQAAWWFFVVLAAYLLIGMVTGDFESSINGTALTLLGIGAATAIGSVAIDVSKSSTAIATARTQADEARARIAELTQTIADLRSRSAPPTEIQAEERRLVGERERLDRLFTPSRGFFLDIISDADGVGFHRFQIVAWTIVLTVIFGREVYHNLSMPSFNETLLGLQGLSAATYLGLKIPEASVAGRTA
jgi:hypothetical protein